MSYWYTIVINPDLFGGYIVIYLCGSYKNYGQYSTVIWVLTEKFSTLFQIPEIKKFKTKEV
jgi:hypothetical protein